MTQINRSAKVEPYAHIVVTHLYLQIIGEEGLFYFYGKEITDAEIEFDDGEDIFLKVTLSTGETMSITSTWFHYQIMYLERRK